MSESMDTKLRELTLRLMAMAPEAPPFPEEDMVQLKSSPSPAPPTRRRNPLVWVGVAAAAALLTIGLPLLLLHGGSAPSPNSTVPPATQTTETPVTTAPVSTASFDVTLYFLADYVDNTDMVGPFLTPVRRQVTAPAVAGRPDVSDQLQAALTALLAGPTTADDQLRPGVSSSIPNGTKLLGVTLDQTGDQPRIVLDFNEAFESGGGTFSMGARLAQVVYTATEFGIPAVSITIDGQPVETFSSEGIILDGPQTRDVYRDLLPPVFAEQPLPGDTLTSPVEIAGVANTFEAVLLYRIELDNGDVLADGNAMASCGTGCWGDFTITSQYTLAVPSNGYVVMYDASAKDGSSIDVVRIPVTLQPAEASAPEIVGLEGVVDGMTVVAPSIGIGVLATGTDTIAIDGSVLPAGRGEPVGGVQTYSADTEVTLAEGPNEIAVVLTGPGGTTTETIHVTYAPNAEQQIAFLTQVGSDQIVADYVQWLTGDEANQAAFEDGAIGSVDEGVPNDYYIRNTNPQLRTLPLADNALVILQTPAVGSVTGVAVSTDAWLGLFKNDGSPWNYETDVVPDWPAPDYGYFGASMINTPYWLTLDGNGNVIQIEQQYIP
jgi:germination protein M